MILSKSQSNSRLRRRGTPLLLKTFTNACRPIITIYLLTRNFMTIPNFYSNFWFRPRILRYWRFEHYFFEIEPNLHTCVGKSDLRLVFCMRIALSHIYRINHGPRVFRRVSTQNIHASLSFPIFSPRCMPRWPSRRHVASLIFWVQLAISPRHSISKIQVCTSMFPEVIPKILNLVDLAFTLCITAIYY